jgi:GNAT superfamily N-acetyltransferase
MNKWLSRFCDLSKDWYYAIKQDGFQKAVPLIIDELKQLPYRKAEFAILIRPVTMPCPAYTPKIDLNIRPLTEADLDYIAQIDRPSEVKACADRLAAGHRGLIAFHEGQPVGHAWTSTDFDADMERIDIGLKPGDLYCTDAYTAPAFRGKGIQTALTIARLELARDWGYQRTVCFIRRDNVASMAVWQRKLRAKVIGCFDFTRLGIWRKTIVREDLMPVRGKTLVST